jgi:hypothetical protein
MQPFSAAVQAQRLGPHLDIRVVRRAFLGSAVEVCDRDRYDAEHAGKVYHLTGPRGRRRSHANAASARPRIGEQHGDHTGDVLHCDRRSLSVAER